jgi:putative glycosyltransferase (TIGR04348 family)
LLRALGHRVALRADGSGRDDVLVALHARRSAGAVRRFRAAFPERPVIVALTGTDLYHDLGRSRLVTASLAAADRLIVLHPGARAVVPVHLRAKVRTVRQSASVSPRPARRSARHFDVCVLAHLRPVKDPLRAAFAARALPRDSRIRIRHAGRALAPAMAQRARAEEARNPRYRWLGELSHPRARALLASSRALVLSSRLEGGANVIGEAAVAGVPVLVSRIDGSIGLLGRRYRGFFPVGDNAALARLLRRVEIDRRFREHLTRYVRRLAPRFAERHERAAWRAVLAELTRTAPRRS